MLNTNKPNLSKRNDLFIKGKHRSITLNHMPSFDYLEHLASYLSKVFNSQQFKNTCGREARYFRFHKFGDNAKTIQVPTIANRSVKLNLADKSQNKKPSVITHKQGSLITSKPCREGLMLSMAIELCDAETSGHITSLDMHQEVETLTETLNDTLNKELLKLIEQSEDYGNLVKEMPETPSAVGLKARGEALQEAIYTAKAEVLSFGKEMSDYIVGLSDTAFTALEYSARINGFQSLSDMFGTEVFAFTSLTDETGIANYGYLIPRRHTAISFEEQQNGDVFRFIVTRKPELQSSIMEIVCNAEVLAAGFTELDMNYQTVNVKMPLLTKFSLKIA